MLRRIFLAVATLLCVVPALDAQTTARLGDQAFARAQELVSDGNGAAGRALMDSVVKATSPTSPLYPQALFWRATLAASAADAERDYRNIVVDYPLAPQAEDALLRLAQLELARGDREGALAHLQRIPRDYPRSKSLARANYWTARVLFEKNDIANACAANASALSQTTAGEIELRNQIEYQGQRCTAHAARAAAAATPPVENAPGATPPVTAPADTTAVDTVLAAPASTTPQSVAAVEPPAQNRPRIAPPTEAKDTKPSVVEPKTPVKSSASAPARPAALPAGAEFSVQVAAYTRKADADKLVASLIHRGYRARVDGASAPFRVRVGRYPTAKEAETALKEIKAQKMAGFVVRAPER